MLTRVYSFHFFEVNIFLSLISSYLNGGVCHGSMSTLLTSRVPEHGWCRTSVDSSGTVTDGGLETEDLTC